MARWLPYHEDRYFLSLSAAARGAYVPKFKQDLGDGEQGTAAVNRELDNFSMRADIAMRAYQQKKAMRGR